MEPLEHSVLKKPLDGGSLEGISVVDLFEHLVMEPLEHSVLVTTLDVRPLMELSVWEPLEHSDCVVTDHVDLDSLWMAPWDAGGTLGGSCRPTVPTWRSVSFGGSAIPPAVFVDKDCSRLFWILGRMCVLDVNVGQTGVLTGSLGDDPQMNFPRSPMSPGDVGMLLSVSVSPMGNTSRRRGSVGNGHSPGIDSMIVMSFPRKSSTPGEMCVVELESIAVMGFPRNSSTPDERCAVELDFPRASFPPGESCAEDRNYIRPACLAGSPVCAWTVTGSLLFGSPHRLVRSCFCSAVLFLRRIDELDIFRKSTDVPQNHLLATVISRLTPDICLLAWTVLISPSFCGEIGDLSHCKRLGQYLIPLGNFMRIVLILCYICRVFAVRFMASSRSPDMDQAGPSCAPSEPLPGTFLGLALDLRSEKLYNLAHDIPDVMGLRALRPSAAIVKVMSVPDSQCIRVVTPDDHENIGFHEILLHDMEEEELPFVTTSEHDYLRRVWPKTLFIFMSRYQQDLEHLRKECKERFGCTQSGNCTHCGKHIQRDLGKFIAFCHMELAQLWRCPVMWCTVWKGSAQDCIDHMRRTRNVPLSVKAANLAKFFSSLWRSILCCLGGLARLCPIGTGSSVGPAVMRLSGVLTCVGCMPFWRNRTRQ